jgi:translation initiation factor 3 subunit A
MLMRMQVEQMEKEKKELNDKMRMITKRIDHLERAFRKDERPLLAQDYEKQQADDKKIFEELQKSRVETARAEYQRDIETKRRLIRMMDDYHAHLDVITAQRGEEFAKKREKAFRKIEEEKAKRREAVLKKREEERLRFEEEDRIAREKEEEEIRLEEGAFSASSDSFCFVAYNSRRARRGGRAPPCRGAAQA